MKRIDLLVISLIMLMIYSCKKEEPTINKGLPVVTTAEIKDIGETSAVCGGTVNSDGNSTVTAKGVCWSLSENPTIADKKTVDGTGLGVFNSKMTTLTSGKTYYVRAYATNSIGTSYGENRKFTTTYILVSLPTTTTKEVSSITSNSAECGGNVTNDGNSAVTAKGVCWSKYTSPTVADNKTNDGQGLGSFTSNITGLTSGTTYYVRAYATNSKGTNYGNQKSFKTTESSQNPIATTVSAVQTGSEYSYSGFEYNGYYYNYKFYWETTFSYSNTQYADTIGFILGGWWYYYTTVSDGTKTNYWTTYSNNSSVNRTYQAYAIKSDGSYIYGTEKSITLSYGGKNQTIKKLELNVIVNEKNPIKRKNNQQLDNNQKILLIKSDEPQWEITEPIK